MVANKSWWTVNWGPPVRTNVNLPEDLYWPAKALAARRRADGDKTATFAGLLNQALHDYLEKHDALHDKG